MHSEKVGAFRANKSQRGGGAFFAAHTRTALIYGSTLRGLLKMFERGWGWGSDSLESSRKLQIHWPIPLPYVNLNTLQ